MDINPLAVLITRLRLFIALIDARLRGGDTGGELEPLPNLETKCLAANTLCVQLAEQGTFGGDGEAAVDDLREARRAWVSAHYPEAKAMALADERAARARLREVLAGWRPAGELAWLDLDLLSPLALPAHFDIRQLFPAPPGGWSIVLGNPPYQKPDAPDKARGRRLGYAGASADLYLMFIEASLAVLRPGGNAVLIVPHSIVFGIRMAPTKTRKLIEEQAAHVTIRTYDNRPQPLFPALPWLKTQSDKGNAQRPTILSLGKKASPNTPGPVVIESGGLIRLNACNRETVLRQPALRQRQRHWRKQWSQAPTPELADLLAALRDEDRVPPVGAEMQLVTFLPSARYFLSCLPDGALDNPGRKGLLIPDDQFYWPWIGLYNSHLFHAYWLMIGDAYHVKAEAYTTIRPPAGWEDEGLRTETELVARRLLAPDVLNACLLRKKDGTVRHPLNVNYHKPDTPGPAIVNELDCLLLAAYGFAPEPLIGQMTTIREEGAHRLTVDRPAS